jgi:hypothetical protein
MFYQVSDIVLPFVDKWSHFVRDSDWKRNLKVRLTEAHTKSDVQDKTEVVFVHVFRAYPICRPIIVPAWHRRE